jgi:hypothetical protein
LFPFLTGRGFGFVVAFVAFVVFGVSRELLAMSFGSMKWEVNDVITVSSDQNQLCLYVLPIVDSSYLNIRI